MIDAISKDNQLRIQLESDERQKQLDNQMERDRLAEQRKFEDMKDNNRIRQLQVEGENRIKEAKLKGDIEANIKRLNNEVEAQSQKHNQEVLKIQNDTLKINKEYELRQKQEQYLNEQR